MTKTNQLIAMACISVFANIPNIAHPQDLKGLLGKVQQFQQKMQDARAEPDKEANKSNDPEKEIENKSVNQQINRPQGGAARGAVAQTTKIPPRKSILSGWDEINSAHSPSSYLPKSLGGYPDSRKIEVRYYLKTSDGHAYQFGAHHEVNCQTSQLRALSISSTHLSHDQHPRVFFERPDFQPSSDWVDSTTYPLYPALIEKACAENPLPKAEGYWDFSPTKQTQTISEKFDIRGIKLGMSLQEVLSTKAVVDHKNNRGLCTVSDPRTPYIEVEKSRHAFDFYIACDSFSYFDGISNLIVGFINGKSHYIGLNAINTYRENTNKSENHIPPIVQTLSIDKMKSEPEITEHRSFGSDSAISYGARKITYSWKNTTGESFRITPRQVFKNTSEKLPFNFPDMAINVTSADYLTLRDQIISRAIQQQEKADKAASEKVKSNI